MALLIIGPSSLFPFLFIPMFFMDLDSSLYNSTWVGSSPSLKKAIQARLAFFLIGLWTAQIGEWGP